MKRKKYLLKLLKASLFYLSFSTIELAMLTGCTNNPKTQNYELVSYNGDIKYEDLNKSILIKTIINDYEEILIVIETIENNKIVYKDIVTGNTINNNDSTIILDNVNNYLEKLDMIKDSYNTEDIEVLKYRILSEYELDDNLYSEEYKRSLKID